MIFSSLLSCSVRNMTRPVWGCSNGIRTNPSPRCNGIRPMIPSSPAPPRTTPSVPVHRNVFLPLLPLREIVLVYFDAVWCVPLLFTDLILGFGFGSRRGRRSGRIGHRHPTPAPVPSSRTAGDQRISLPSTDSIHGDQFSELRLPSLQAFQHELDGEVQRKKKRGEAEYVGMTHAYAQSPSPQRRNHLRTIILILIQQRIKNGSLHSSNSFPGL